MINYDLTEKTYGYKIEYLSNGSSKNVCVDCDYCGELTTKTYKAYNNQRNIIQKDSCGKLSCKYKKREDISISLYGVKNSAQRPEIKNKIRDTNIDRLKSEAFKQQSRATNLEKYGNENIMKIQKFRDKQKNTLIDKYGVDNIMKDGNISKKASAKMKQTKISKGLIRIYEGKTRPEIATEKGFSRSHFGKLVTKYGIEEAMQMEPYKSSLEKYFASFLQEYNIEYTSQKRIGSKIADFCIKNLIIEIDGLYWHSDYAKTDQLYHINKKQTYSDNNYSSLFFREDELRDKFDIIKSIVLNKLNKSQRIYARKCIVSQLDNQQADLFFETNHLMGKGRGKTYCLLYENKIVCCMRLKRLKNKEYEISRFCNINYHTVVGGFDKLLKVAVNDLKPTSIITFIDQRYGEGKYLSSLGFRYVHSYPSFRWTDGFESFHRLKFPGNSGYNKGLFKIWDCGQAKWIIDY